MLIAGPFNVAAVPILAWQNFYTDEPHLFDLFPYRAWGVLGFCVLNESGYNTVKLQF
jgi:hypothetical protein